MASDYYETIRKGLELHTCDERECTARGTSWLTVVGMASDNIIDGIGIGIGYAVNPVLGLVITLAVLAHETPRGMVTTAIMREARHKLNRIIPMLIFAGALYPAGTAISGFVPETSMHLAVAFVAGVFIYIGASALLTEAHRRFNARVMATVMVGALLALGLRFLE